MNTPCPLLFTFRDTVFGNGFVAEVIATNGRVLVEHADGEFWCYGVNPGGIAAAGATGADAATAFRDAFRRVLTDFAGQAATLDEFRSTVVRFVDETNEPTERDWLAAVERVRRGEVSADEIQQRKPATSPRSVTVLLKQAFTARDNEAELRHALAA